VSEYYYKLQNPANEASRDLSATAQLLVLQRSSPRYLPYQFTCNVTSPPRYLPYQFTCNVTSPPRYLPYQFTCNVTSGFETSILGVLFGSNCQLHKYPRIKLSFNITGKYTDNLTVSATDEAGNINDG